MLKTDNIFLSNNEKKVSNQKADPLSNKVYHISYTMLLGCFKDADTDLCSNGKHKTDLIKSREMQDQIVYA